MRTGEEYENLIHVFYSHFEEMFSTILPMLLPLFLCYKQLGILQGPRQSLVLQSLEINTALKT